MNGKREKESVVVMSNTTPSKHTMMISPNNARITSITMPRSRRWHWFTNWAEMPLRL